MLRKLFLLLAVATLVAGCGNKTEEAVEAETEGIYLEAGGLTYQVQLSRFLNPGNVDDFQYLMGLPEGINRELPGDEIWFGVWMRVKNYSDETLTPTTDFTIVDTQENEFRPVPLDRARTRSSTSRFRCSTPRCCRPPTLPPRAGRSRAR